MAVVGLLKNTRSASVRTFTSGPSWTTNNSTVPGRAPVTSTVVVAVSIGLFPLPVKIGHGCAGPRGGPSPVAGANSCQTSDTSSWRQQPAPVTANLQIGDRCPDSARMASVRIPRRSFEAVELIENLVDGRGWDAEVFALRVPEAVAYVEDGEFTLEVCCGSVAHGLILPGGGR